MNIEAKLSKRIGPSRVVNASAKLYKLDGNSRPYFSLTGEELRHGVIECCGQMHETLLEHWPELKPLADIHLSDDTGTPMHAVENGWYWAGGCKEYNRGGKSDPPRADYLASHLRISLIHAQAIIQDVLSGEITKNDFAKYCETCKTRWQQEATEAIALIAKLKEAA